MARELDEKIDDLASWVVEHDKVVVFTGAGISTESGLPDYRGPDGVWTRRDKGLPPPKMKVPWSEVKPNESHLAIVELQNMGKMQFLISQNVDNLHLKSGIRPELIAELHGNSELMRCLKCDKQFTLREVGWDKTRWGNGYRTDPVRKGQPRCKCGGRLISSVVNFGDPLPEEALMRAIKHASNCDVFIVVGSSLVVTPASHMPEYALENGAKVAIINMGETPLDDRVQLRFWEKAGEVLQPTIARIKAQIEKK
jgi:NAD-dependent SIR2 family protein deacetylase